MALDFELSSEHLLLQKTIRGFVHREIAPQVKEADRRGEMPVDVLPRMAAQGLLGVCIPSSYGGQDMDYISLGLACEELECVDTSLRVILSVHVGLNSLGLLQWATEEQKQRFLVPQARGEKIAAFALTEPGAGSDAARSACTARRSGSDYLLTGEKTWISLATKADHVLWFARTNPEAADPHEGLSAFLLEAERPGVSRGDLRGKLGVRAGSTGWIRCDEVRVPESCRIGQEGEGFTIAMSCLDNGRFTVAAGAAGLIRACLAASVGYARERSTFGREIAHHQLIQEKIARMSQQYEIARLLYLRAGWLKNQGRRNTRESSLAKWYATEAAFDAASQALQVHGAYGYSDEFDVERFFRNARGAMIYEGTSEIHTLIQAGYALGLREEGALRAELPAHRTL